MRPATLGELRGTLWEQHAGRSIKDELRANLLARLQNRQQVFPGLVGYDDTVIPLVINALLSRHNFILLGLRGQAKTRLLRQLTALLDEAIPVLAGTELNDDPFRRVSVQGQLAVAEAGDDAPIAWLERSDRYIEKLATPDVTVADIIGDLDPIRAASLGTRLGDERAIHYGLLPRANRGIFAVNELPDLAGRVQVALFNIMQEGDVQIKGYPVRLPLDVLLVFSANPEDYTARGKIITPLKDRIGSEIRTHYPSTAAEAAAITRQEAWLERDCRVLLPEFVSDAVEEVAFQAREDSRVDAQSGVSQRLPISLLESVVSGAEQRALLLGEGQPVARAADIFRGLPAITGKLELTYEGELRGAEAVARDIILRAVEQVLSGRVPERLLDEVVAFFEAEGVLKLPADLPSGQLPELFGRVPGLLAAASSLAGAESATPEELGAAGEFILEGLYARKRIGRSEEQGFTAAAQERPEARIGRNWN
jgi:magnesium chelatase subunit I